MKSKWTNNWGLKIGSLLIAVIVWIFVTNINNPVKTKLFSDVKIEVINEDSVTEIDKVFDIISEDSVSIKVTERKHILNSLGKDDFKVIADMENLTEMNTVPLRVSCINPMVSWEEMVIEPSTMKVKMEQIKQQEFAVNISVSGEPVKGYEIGTTELVQGKAVQIAGAESLLNKINQVVAGVSVPNIRSNQRVDAALKIYDKNGDAFTEAQMSRLQIKDQDGVVLPDNTVMVDVTLWEIMNDIPVNALTVGTPAEGYEVTGVSMLPVTVNLVGTKEALAAVGGKIVLNEPINVDGVSESFTQDINLTETLAQIPEIRLVNGADPIITVSVQIEKNGVQSVELPLSNLDIYNKHEGLLFTYSPADAITLIIHADNDSVGEISASEILAEIDLEECTKPGTYEIPVKVTLPKGYSLTSEPVLVVTTEELPKQSEETQASNTAS